MTSRFKQLQRREAIKFLSAAAVGSCIEPQLLFAQNNIRIGGRLCQTSISNVSAHAVRIRITEQQRSSGTSDDGAVVLDAATSGSHGVSTERLAGGLHVQISHEPLTFHITDRDGRRVQQLRVDENTGSVNFPLGDGLVLGMGEGGPQFDRRGNIDHMRSGQGGYRLRTHGGRVPLRKY